MCGQPPCGEPRNIMNNDQMHNVSVILAISFCYMLGDAVTCGR